MNKPTAGGEDCCDVVGDGPMKLELLQVAGLRVQHIGCRLEAMRSAIKVIEVDFETARRTAPYAAKRMVLADDQRAVWFQDTSGFSVIACQVRNPYRNM